MAFGIAVLQAKYGANLSWNIGDDVYDLPDENAPGTGYACLHLGCGQNDTIATPERLEGIFIYFVAFLEIYGAFGIVFEARFPDHPPSHRWSGKGRPRRSHHGAGGLPRHR